MNLEKWKEELQERIDTAPETLLERQRLLLNRLKEVPVRAEQFSYLPCERAKARLQKEHEFISRQYAKHLRARSLAQSSEAEKEVVDSLTLYLQIMEKALLILREELKYVESGEAAELFREVEPNSNTLLMDAKTLNECWSADPTFDGLRYIALVTGLPRKELTAAIRAYRAQQQQEVKENE
jgi:hypothetical protein